MPQIKRNFLDLLEELQLLHSKTILDQTKVNISEKGIQASQDENIGPENNVIKIRLFPKEETIEEVESLEKQLQEQNPLDILDMKLQQPEQSATEHDFADNLIIFFCNRVGFMLRMIRKYLKNSVHVYR